MPGLPIKDDNNTEEEEEEEKSVEEVENDNFFGSKSSPCPSLKSPIKLKDQYRTAVFGGTL